MTAPVSCAACGQTRDEPPPTWSLQVSERGRTWLCALCQRDRLRDVEMRLDEPWA